MKRYKTLASCCMAVACMAALLAVLTGCSSQQSYTPPEKAATLASPAIGKDGTLRVGVNTDNQPLAGQPASSSKIVGIDVDVAAALADSFGLKLEIVNVGSDPEAALKEGTVDIVMGIDKTDSDTTFWKSDAYLPTGVALFAVPSNTTVPTSTSGSKFAAQVSSKSAWAVTNEFGTEALSTTDDLKSAFAELASGQVQYVAADAIIGTYAAHSAGDDVHVVALMQQAGGYSVGVSDSNTDLKQAVSEALATLSSNGTIGVIETKWLGTALDLSATPLTAGATKSTDTKTETPTTDEGEGDNTENANDNEAPEEGADNTDTPPPMTARRTRQARTPCSRETSPPSTAFPQARAPERRAYPGLFCLTGPLREKRLTWSALHVVQWVRSKRPKRGSLWSNENCAPCSSGWRRARRPSTKPSARCASPRSRSSATPRWTTIAACARACRKWCTARARRPSRSWACAARSWTTGRSACSSRGSMPRRPPRSNTP